MIRTIFFDFGGCLDAPGIHTRTLFWSAFQNQKLLSVEQQAAFQEAYTLADQKMMQTGIARDLALQDFNRLNAALIAEGVGIRSSHVAQAADEVSALMAKHLMHARSVLEQLHSKYSLGVISNFTGNLEVILREFQLRTLFQGISESFYVGASKPDLRIFEHALQNVKTKPGEALFVGDNPVNDVEPAKKFGLKTALIHVPGGKKDCGADIYLEDLDALPSFIQRM